LIVDQSVRTVRDIMGSWIRSESFN